METLQTTPQIMVITGTSKGLGKGIALYYLAEGWMVAGCSRGTSTIEHENYFHSCLDIGTENQVQSWIRSVKKRFKRIDVLVCNAGYVPANFLLTTTSSQVLTDLLHINVAGTFYVCREVLKTMLLQRAGRVVTMSSMAVGLHEEGTAAYSASKAAIVEMTKIMAKEFAPVGITCNVVAPSMLITDAVEAFGEDVIKRALSKLTLKRTVTIEEICNVISFFVNPESRCVTGQVVHMGLVC